MRGAIRDGVVAALPPALKIIDEHQQDILAAIATSSAPVHVIHASRAAANPPFSSAVSHSMPHTMPRRWPGRPSRPARGPARLFSWSSSAHERCDTSLQTLLRTQALAPGQAVFGGRLLDRFLEAGVVDGDVARFQKIVLAAPEPSRLLREYEAALAGLLALHEGYVRQHADGAWVTIGEVEALKRDAKHALENLWSFHQACSEAEAAALRRVAVLLATTGVALKIFGRAATPGSPAARLLKQRKSATLILDEVQRCPLDLLRLGQPARYRGRRWGPRSRNLPAGAAAHGPRCGCPPDADLRRPKASDVCR